MKLNHVVEAVSPVPEQVNQPVRVDRTEAVEPAPLIGSGNRSASVFGQPAKKRGFRAKRRS
jgi:hypothetical protein